MRKLTTALLAFTALTLPSAAFSETLPDMLGKLGEHPQVTAARQNVGQADAAEEEAFSGFLPRVDISTSNGPEEVDRTSLSPAGSRSDENASSYSARVTQNVFQGFRTKAAVKTAEVGTEVAKLNLESTHQQILFEGASAYIEVLRFVELTELAQDNQETLREQLNLEDERVRRGSGIAVDALQAKSRLQVSKERYTAFMGGLKDAISRYTQVFNEAPNLDNMQLPPVPEPLIPESLEAAINIALAKNPQLASSKSNVVLADTARTTAKSGYYPSVDIVGSSSYDDNVAGVFGEEVNHALKLETSWQIFSGFADRSRVRQADFGYNAALEAAQFAERKIAEEVKLAWSSLVTSRERTELLDNAVNIAGEVYDARKRLRDAGSETAINVLDAENELYSARIDAASARYDYYVAIYRLLFAMGLIQAEVDQTA